MEVFLVLIALVNHWMSPVTLNPLTPKEKLGDAFSFTITPEGHALRVPFNAPKKFTTELQVMQTLDDSPSTVSGSRSTSPTSTK